MNKAIIKIYNIVSRDQSKFVYLLIAICICVSFVYGLFVYRTIEYTIAIRDNETKIADLGSLVGELDTQYITKSSKITPELAKEYGLYETKVSAYINRTTSLGSVARARLEL